MCQEVFELVCKMDMKDVETRMALQCAPLIVGIKISNLLIIQEGSGKVLHAILKNTGISYYRLLNSHGRMTYLLFRREQLAAFLNHRQVREILQSEGYEGFGLGAILNLFQRRYEDYMERGKSFPHEMGILLGYPVEDVRGFMEHGGKDFLYSGYWKVYENVGEKKRIFQSYEAAREYMVQRLSGGMGIRDIITEGKVDRRSALA